MFHTLINSAANAFEYDATLPLIITLTASGIGLGLIIASAFTLDSKKVGAVALLPVGLAVTLFGLLFSWSIGDIDRNVQLREWASKEYNMELTSKAAGNLIANHNIIVDGKIIDLIYDNDAEGYILTELENSKNN